MQILNLLPYSPCPPHFGGALRIYHLLRQMAQRHDVSVIMFGDEGARRLVRETFGGTLKDVFAVEKPLKLSGMHKRWSQFRSLFGGGSATTHAYHSPAMQEMIDKVVARKRFDLIQLENHPTGLYRIDAPGTPRILDVQNVEYDNIRRMAGATSSPVRRAFYAAECRKVRREEYGVFGAQDAILVTSPRDKSLINDDFPHIPKFVIPNGVDTSYFRPVDALEEVPSLVFTGAMNYFPNADGIMYFLKEIFPHVRRQIPGIRVTVVGGGPPAYLVKMATDNIIVTGHVEDVRPYVHRAGIYVVPLRMGGGTRLKVLEALAMGKPVVTTSVGCEGIDLEDRRSALIADDPEQFAAAVVELTLNRNLRRTLVTNGRELVLGHYEWSAIGDALACVYDAIVPDRQTTPQLEKRAALHPMAKP